MKLQLFSYLNIDIAKKEKRLLQLVIVCTICFMWAQYSLYWIRHLDVYMMVATILLLWSNRETMFDGASKIGNSLIGAALFIYVVIPLLHFEKPSVGVTCEIILLSCLLRLKEEYKAWIYDRFITVTAILLGLCAVEYILACFLHIEHINHTPIYRFEGDAHYFYQGILNIFPYYYTYSIARFQAFTEEPGLVGTLCAFMIACMNSQKQRWQFVVILISGILSLSLAFYMLFGLWILYNAINSKSTKNIILVLFVLVPVYFYFRAPIEEAVFDRVAGQSSISAVDNRANETFSKAFDEFLTSSDVLFGHGLRYFHSTFGHVEGESSGNAGAKPFIYSYGMFSMALLFIVFSFTFLKINGYNRRSYFILLLFWLSFYQRDVWSTPYNMIVLMMFSSYDKVMQRKTHVLNKPFMT